MLPATHLEVNVVEESGQTKLELTGWLDSVTIGRFRTAMHKLTQRELQNVVIDCARLDYIDSLSLGGMLYWRDRLKAGGKVLSFVNCRGDVLNAFRLAGFHKLFRFD